MIAMDTWPIIAHWNTEGNKTSEDKKKVKSKPKTATVRARIDANLKESAEAVLANLGLSPSAAIRMLYRQIEVQGRLPFGVLPPGGNEATGNTEFSVHYDAGDGEGESEIRIFDCGEFMQLHTFDICNDDAIIILPEPKRSEFINKIAALKASPAQD